MSHSYRLDSCFCCDFCKGAGSDAECCGAGESAQAVCAGKVGFQGSEAVETVRLECFHGAQDVAVALPCRDDMSVGEKGILDLQVLQVRAQLFIGLIKRLD